MTNVIVDVIILSYAKNVQLRKITEEAIVTLLNSEESIKFNVIVVESNIDCSPFEFENCNTIYPKKKFGYNKYMNIALDLTKNKYVCLCNNDLIFHKGWASEILYQFQTDQTLMSASPICSNVSNSKYPKINSGNYYGYEIGKHVSGWCIFLDRRIINKIGKLDESFKFWYCDNDYANTLMKFNIKHVLISTAIVDHLNSRTLISETQDSQARLMNQDFLYYQYKWKHQNFLKYISQEFRRFLKNRFWKG